MCNIFVGDITENGLAKNIWNMKSKMKARGPWKGLNRPALKKLKTLTIKLKILFVLLHRLAQPCSNKVVISVAVYTAVCPYTGLYCKHQARDCLQTSPDVLQWSLYIHSPLLHPTRAAAGIWTTQTVWTEKPDEEVTRDDVSSVHRSERGKKKNGEQYPYNTGVYNKDLQSKGIQIKFTVPGILLPTHPLCASYW